MSEKDKSSGKPDRKKKAPAGKPRRGYDNPPKPPLVPSRNSDVYQQKEWPEKEKPGRPEEIA
jgi:hypothetical protein